VKSKLSHEKEFASPLKVKTVKLMKHNVRKYHGCQRWFKVTQALTIGEHIV